jgi:DNA-binding transcriptional regulator LsrR (DeoR family)
MGAFEQHYTVQEIAEKWHLSETVVRKIFRDEPGVIRIDSEERRFKRGYCTLRIPESVAMRVHSRIGQRQSNRK